MKEDLHILIQQYLDNSMPENDRAAFEQSLKDNPEWQQEFDLMADLEKEMGNQKVNDFTNQLEEIMASPVQSKTEGRNVNFTRRIMTLAASTLLIGGALWWIFNNDQSNQFATLADAYFIHYPANDVIRGSQEEIEILENYNQKNYALAAKELEALGNKTKDSQKWLFSAISYLAMDKPKQTVILLEKIENTPAIINKKYYFLGLAYLKIGDKTKALAALKKINPADKFIFDKTQKLISKLE